MLLVYSSEEEEEGEKGSPCAAHACALPAGWIPLGERVVAETDAY